jgi:hypothetical protein
MASAAGFLIYLALTSHIARMNMVTKGRFGRCDICHNGCEAVFSFLKSGPVHTPLTPPLGGRVVKESLCASPIYGCFPGWDPDPEMGPKHLGTISHVPDLLWCGRKDPLPLPQHDETKLEPRFGGAFFCTEKGALLDFALQLGPVSGDGTRYGWGCSWLGVNGIIAWAGLGCGFAWPSGSGRPSR